MWQVPALAEFRSVSGVSLPSCTTKLATSPVGLPLNEFSSATAKRYLRSLESMTQSTLSTLAATPAGARSAVTGSQSKARIPSGVLEPTKTRWRAVAARLGNAAAARVAAEAVFTNSRRERFFMVQAIIADGGGGAPVLEECLR